MAPWTLCWLLVAPAGAAETVVDLSGEVPEDDLDHFFLDLEVPEGTQELEVEHEALGEGDVLDWGLDGPEGFRGWGGGNTEDAVVGEAAASRSYLAGPLTPGTWRVVVGKAVLGDGPHPFEVTVTLRDEATLAAQPERTPYVPAQALETGARWYAGDLHVHDLESGDAVPTIDEVAAFAESVGLDFVFLSDHNTVSQADFLVDAQARWPELLLLPAIEFTTYDGHANALGATEWVDHRIGQPGATIEAAAEAIHGQGALLSVNHPTLDLGSACIGCAWRQELDLDEIDAVEVITGGWLPSGGFFYQGNIALWEGWLDQGARVAAVGGSDDHRAGTGTGTFDSPIGNPTTLVWAEELSHAGILAGIRSGRTVVKLQGPDDPMVELWPDPLPEAGEDPGAHAVFTATVRDGDGAALVWVVDGVAEAPVAVSGDAFSDARTFAEGQRVRVQLDVDDQPRVTTSHWWVGPAEAVDSGTGSAGDTGDTPDRGGCGCTAGAGPAGAVAALLLALGLSRRRRR